MIKFIDFSEMIEETKKELQILFGETIEEVVVKNIRFLKVSDNDFWYNGFEIVVSTDCENAFLGKVKIIIDDNYDFKLEFLPFVSQQGNVVNLRT